MLGTGVRGKQNRPNLTEFIWACVVNTGIALAFLLISFVSTS